MERCTDSRGNCNCDRPFFIHNKPVFHSGGEPLVRCACLTFRAYDWAGKSAVVDSHRLLHSRIESARLCGLWRQKLRSDLGWLIWVFPPAFCVHCGLWAFTFNLALNSHRFYEGINAVDPHSLSLIRHLSDFGRSVTARWYGTLLFISFFFFVVFSLYVMYSTPLSSLLNEKFHLSPGLNANIV